MTPIVLWMALAWGVNTGYEPAPDGHLEYIVQIEPQLVDSLTAGNDVISEVPAGLDVRHYRIRIGNGQLPRIAVPAGQGAVGGAPAATATNPVQGPTPIQALASDAAQHIREGYQRLAPAGGAWIFELDAVALGDMKHADLTGDIPPGMVVTRFVVSTNPGTIPGEHANQKPTMPPSTSPLAIVPAEPGADGDPSPWKPNTIGVTPANPAATSDTGPALGAPALADDPVGGTDAPPPARPGHRESATGAPSLANPSRLDPPGRSFDHGSTTPDSTPGRFPGQPDSRPIVTTAGGEDEPDAEADEGGKRHKTRKPKDEETATEPATKPWLPLTFSLMALCASLGGNVFLGWIAWESYTRDQEVIAKVGRGKASLAD